MSEGESDERRPWWRRRPALLGAGVAALLGLLYGLDLLATWGEVPRDVVVAGADIGGLDRAAAEAQLRSRLEPRLSQPVTVVAGEIRESIEPETAKVIIDWNATLDRAQQPTFNPFQRVLAFFVDRPVEAVAVGDEQAIRARLSTIAKQVDKPRIEGTIRFDEAKPVAVDPVPGRRLDVARGSRVVVTKWVTAKAIELPVETMAVRATAQGVRTALERFAKPAVAGPVVLKANGDDKQMTPESIAAVLTFTPERDGTLKPEVDPKKFRGEMGDDLADTETKSQDARIKFGKKAATVKPSVDGHEVDWDATAGALLETLRGGGEGNGSRTTKVTYTDKPAKLTAAELAKLGIKEVVGKFTTGGFAPDSGVNIRQVAKEVNGAIVRPGETFSLNEHTGPRGIKQGYVAAAVIENGELSRAVGGGISQFATTLYNATYFAGMVDVEHKEHSRYISRYPLAREATVYQNPDGTSVIDLKFRNDSPHGVAIQTIWTPSDITVKIWGTKRYRVSSVTSEPFGYTAAPVITKPWGTPCTPQSGASGYSATDTRVIKDLDGKVVKREKRTVTYRPQQAVRCAPPPPKPEPKPDEDKPEDKPGGKPGDKPPTTTKPSGVAGALPPRP